MSSSENYSDSEMEEEVAPPKEEGIYLQGQPCSSYQLGKCLDCCNCPSCNRNKGRRLDMEGEDICRFKNFRKLRWMVKNGWTLARYPIHSKGYPENDLKIWMPGNISPGEINLDADVAKYLILHVADPFFEFVVKQEKDCSADFFNTCPQRVIWKQRIPGDRELCDVCFTTLFNYHWTCGNCGFVVCISCFNARKSKRDQEDVEEQEVESGPAKDEFGWLYCHINKDHIVKDLLFTRIISKKALEDLTSKLQELRKSLANDRRRLSSARTIKKPAKYIQFQVNSLCLSDMSDSDYRRLCNGHLLQLLNPAHPGNLRMFQREWKTGRPVIVSNVDSRLNKHLWSPESFSRDFGEEENDLVNCMTGKIHPRQKMHTFWDGFEHEMRRPVDENDNPMLLKLKDWPPGDDFANKLSDRFEDLMGALPLGEYTHRDGKLNLAARLPGSFSKPDLGPKMYIAYGSCLHLDKGTTNLHLDVSDAVNLLVYVGVVKDSQANRNAILKVIGESDCDVDTINRVRRNGELPGAIWHIWEGKDADKIRHFLNEVAKKERKNPPHDAIHDQNWYLDKNLRYQLKWDYDVKCYPILQCAGDAVFIPAGAPHQVRNLNNCIKIAEDFVSPENVRHCFQLTEEFRRLTDKHLNREDKLQIKNIVYHTIKDAVGVLEAFGEVRENHG